ncbi:hypothetical protein AB0885_24505, partial [Streptomyces sp. NPDC005534]
MRLSAPSAMYGYSTFGASRDPRGEPRFVPVRDPRNEGQFNASRDPRNEFGVTPDRRGELGAGPDAQGARAMFEEAQRVTVPLHVLLQWDDEGNDRQAAL